MRRLGLHPATCELVAEIASEATAVVLGQLILYRGHRRVYCEHRGRNVCLMCLRSVRLAGLKRLGASACSSVVGNALALWRCYDPAGARPDGGLRLGGPGPHRDVPAVRLLH